MPATNYDIIIEQGATFTLQLVYKTSAGVAVDLTGYSARMQVRESYPAASPLLSFTSAASGGITLGGAAGTILIEASDETTAAIDTRQTIWGVYDLELVPPDGKALRLLEGAAQIRPEATR